MIFSGNLSRYEGCFKFWKAHGYGTRTWDKQMSASVGGKLRYEGGFQDGVFHGQGIVTYLVPETTESEIDHELSYEGGWIQGSGTGME
jgi:uncharacterized protein YndB with AHSA1/START domain